MRVTEIVVNTGQLPREQGFANARLDTVLGAINKGDGQRFAYAFQITFKLSGITGQNIKLTRRVTHKTLYKDFTTSENKVLEVMTKKSLRLVAPTASEDSPNEGNVKREADRIVVQDGPGPSFMIADPKMYPMAFEGKFILSAQTTTAQTLATVQYYVCLLKLTHSARDITAHFEVLETNIPAAPPLTAQA
jgi:hypothetical protein